tara:strand:- start:44 stop:328 length:285 start_codon:yes stop_codon:yes gene_type:complete
MAKVQRFFFGHDTYGKSVEVAQSESGEWFGRVYQTGPYPGYDKWTKYEPHWQTETTNAYDNTVSKHEPVLLWGWNKLQEILDDGRGLPRCRLPA